LILLVQVLSIRNLIEWYTKDSADRSQEAVSATADLKSLKSALLALSEEEVFTKNTILIESLKDLLTKDTKITLIGHIIATNSEDSLNTLKYIQLCKTDTPTNTNELGLLDDGDKEVSNMKRMNSDYINEIEQIEREYLIKFEKIKNYFSLNLDMKIVLEKGLNVKDKIIIKNNKQAEERVKNFAERNKSLIERIDKAQASVNSLKGKIEHKSVYFDSLEKNMKEEYNRLITRCNELKDEYNKLPDIMSIQIEEKRKKITDIKNAHLEKKLGPLLYFKSVLDNHNRSMIEERRVCVNERKALEDTYKIRMKNFNRQHNISIKNIEAQFQHYLQKNKARSNIFMEDAEQYCKKKRQVKRELEMEFMKLSRIVHKQAEVIRQAEEGTYTNGIRTVYVKKMEKNRSISTMSRPTTCQGKIRSNSRMSDLQSRRRSKV